MVRLEDIASDNYLAGVIPSAEVQVISVRRFGDSAVELTYRLPCGKPETTLLYRAQEQELQLVSKNGWDFSADGDQFKLAAEALRISLAATQDPFLAVRSSRIRPLPHQISAVYEKMLPRLPLRYVLADDPGAGKTVMAGLLIKEMRARGDLERCLIVCPGSLCVQWQDELLDKFGLNFTILTREVFETSARRNAFKDYDLCIASLDKLARDESLQELLRITHWDLTVFDEAHKLSAHVYGQEVKYTQRYKLAQLLAKRTENLLLMTATPHNGKPQDFQQFMALIDPDRFAGVTHGAPDVADVSDVMRRLVKEELLTFDGHPLFPERVAHTVSYELTPLEEQIYDQVTEYVRSGFNRAEKIANGTLRNSVGFALTLLQRRLASSPAAILSSLKRRRDRLSQELLDRKTGRRQPTNLQGISRKWGEDFDEEDWSAEEFENLEDQISGISSAETEAELKIEIEELNRLVELARKVYLSKDDRKWQELSKLLQDESTMFAKDGTREKLVIFTEHKDTLDYLANNIRQLLGRDEAVEVICGGMGRDARRHAENRFKNDKDVQVLLATDAAGEGINLQQAHLEISYDLPWNPNKLEQRFGRIHRIGQTETCHLWNLVAGSTREGQVYERLLHKLEVEREVLGGRVFDVLGEVSFGDKSLADLLKDAIRYGSDPANTAKLNELVDGALDQKKLRALLAENALTNDVMDESVVARVREEMERAEARKLQPYNIAQFFISAITALGGRIKKRETGRYEILRVPAMLLEQGVRNKRYNKVLSHYERVCFDSELTELPGFPVAEFVYPGHPLMDTVIQAVGKCYGKALKHGSVLINDKDLSQDPKILFFLESAICDGRRTLTGDKHVIQRDLKFISLDEEGQATNGGWAPYLDYRIPQSDELELIAQWKASGDHLLSIDEPQVLACAVKEIIPQEIERVKNLYLPRLEKVRKAVDQRLTQEVRYYDRKRSEARRNGGDEEGYRKRSEDYARRRKERLVAIDEEMQISPAMPRVVGCALVIPAGLIRLLKEPEKEPQFTADADIRRQIELCAMKVVMDAERDLGFIPRDVSDTNCGYDILSKPSEDHDPIPGEPIQRFIEVKGFGSTSPVVKVSRNEIISALNAPQNSILALCEVAQSNDGSFESRKLIYVKHPFEKEVEPELDYGSFNVNKLIEKGELLFQEEHLYD